MKITQTADTCPECTHTLVRPDADLPWCPACEWNLGAYDRAAPQVKGWGWIDRLAHRLAFRWDGVLFGRFSTERPTRPGWTRAHIALVALSVLLVLVFLGLLAGGILLVLHDFFSWGGLIGVAMVVMAVVIRPRIGRAYPRKRALRREQAPTLFALVDRVAEAVGTTAPPVIGIVTDFNAATGTGGLRRTPFLLIGSPLLAILAPQQRVALLVHELGHQVNGDPARSLLVQPALSAFRSLVNATGGLRTLRGVVFDDDRFAALPLPIELAKWLVNRIVLAMYLVLRALGDRDGQRSEYLADAVAVDVAGSVAAAALLDRTVLMPQIAGLLVHHAETKSSRQWAAMAESMHESKLDDLPRLRQLTLRRTDLWDSHPPEGLRARMVEAWPQQDPQVVLSDADSALIDAELAEWNARAHREFLGTRDYRGPRTT
ncbi:MAG: M48 family metallopeptidase [Umezawaea sp.]